LFLLPVLLLLISDLSLLDLLHDFESLNHVDLLPVVVPFEVVAGIDLLFLVKKSFDLLNMFFFLGLGLGFDLITLSFLRFSSQVHVMIVVINGLVNNLEFLVDGGACLAKFSSLGVDLLKLKLEFSKWFGIRKSFLKFGNFLLDVLFSTEF